MSTSTSPATSTPTSQPRTDAGWWARALLRGQGQVFFMSHPLTGLLMLVGLAVADLRLAAFTILGIIVGTATAWLMKVDRTAIGDGLHGYCPALVGAASYVTWGAGLAGLLSAIVGAIVVVPVTLWMASLASSRALRHLQLAVLTAPFCIVSGIATAIAMQLPHHASLPLEPLPASGAVEFVEELFEGIGQVHFADSYWAGLIILVAIAISSRRAALAALLGVATMTVANPLVGVPVETVAHGLTQYSAVLVAIAIADVFLRDRGPAWMPWVLAVVGSLLTLPVQKALEALHIPVYTWPFILVTWLIVGIANARRTHA